MKRLAAAAGLEGAYGNYNPARADLDQISSRTDRD